MATTDNKAKKPSLVVKLLIGSIDHLSKEGKRVYAEAGALLKEGEHFLKDDLEKLVKAGKAEIYDLAGKQAAAASANGVVITAEGMSKVQPVAKPGSVAPVALSGVAPKVTDDSTPTATAGANVANKGNAVVSAISVTKDTKEGPYTLSFTGETAYLLDGPDGKALDTVSTLGAYAAKPDAQIGFTVTAGDKPMVEGDELFITVAAAAAATK